MADTVYPVTNILTIDIEDWLQSSPELLRPGGKSLTPAPSMRSVTNTRRLLKILHEHDTRATCFILGSMAEAYPSLIAEILDSGHEIASHGYCHLPVYLLQPAEFRDDVVKSRRHLEKITGERIRGYRAPYFSITRDTNWAFPILADLGFEYDSSVFPIHPRYYRVPGWAGAEDAERYPGALEFGDRCLFELPPTTVRIMGQNLPVAGGAFLRLLPLGLFRKTIRHANRNGYPAIFYLHPHDLDDQDLRRPMPGTPLKKRLLRWGLNAGRSSNEAKLRSLLSEFPFTSIQEWMNGSTKDLLLPKAATQVQ